MSRTHYEVLGVGRDAETEQIRRAYLDRARELHPDRFVDLNAADREQAQRRMQDVNEAWRVLGHTGRRRRYDIDLGIRQSRDQDHLSDLAGEVFFAPDDEPVHLSVRLVRILPWAVLFVVLGAIFVFTAYAVDDNSSGGQAGRCVVVDASGDLDDQPCGANGARRVVASVPVTDACPAGTERVQQGTTSPRALCLEV